MRFIVFGILLVAAWGRVFAPATYAAPQRTPAPQSRASAVGVDSTVTLSEITIVATRTSVVSSRAPSRITVRRAEDLAEPGVATVADVLDRAAAGSVRTYGPGGLATASLRGGSASQTLVVLDGMRIENPQLGMIDLSLLPIDVLDGLEIMYGGGSALYGSNGPGGVVYLHSAAPHSRSELKLSLSGGAFGSTRQSIAAAGGLGRVRGRIVLGRVASRGDFAYLNEHLFPARVVRRENADFSRQFAYATADRIGNRGVTRVSGWLQLGERGLPGLEGAAPVGERQRDRLASVWVQHGGMLGRLRGHVRASSQHGLLGYRNPQLQIDDRGRSTVHTLETTGDVKLGQVGSAVVGAFVSTATVDHPSLSLDTASPREHQVAAFTSVTLHGERFTAYPAIRIDRHGGDIAAPAVVFSPRIGANLRLSAPTIGDVNLKSSMGRGYRRPTFNDLFWADAGARGNRNLLPETGWDIDGGIAVGSAAAEAELSVFHHRTANKISWLSGSSGLWQPVNIGRVAVWGMESTARGVLVRSRRRLAGSVSHVYTAARDVTDPSSVTYGQQLRYVPRQQLKGSLRASTSRARMGLAANYSGRRFLTEDGGTSLSGYVVVDAHFGLAFRAVGATVTADVSIENVANIDYAIVKGYPMPPRHAGLRVVARFGGPRK